MSDQVEGLVEQAYRGFKEGWLVTQGGLQWQVTAPQGKDKETGQCGGRECLKTWHRVLAPLHMAPGTSLNPSGPQFSSMPVLYPGEFRPGS